jgi:hypothetical protein
MVLTSSRHGVDLVADRPGGGEQARYQLGLGLAA